MEKILVGMSGGVDSSAAALILKDKGFEVAGVTLKLCKEDKERDLSDAKAVCEKLGIKHFVLDLKDDFNRFVISDFISQYKKGLTPNPCLECNKHIKFGKMLEEAEKLGFDKIATGHYARVTEKDGRFILLRAADKTKDQSYVLYSLTQKQLSRLELPLGGLSKAEIRKMANSASLVSADRPDSQDICFVPDGDYAAFIEENSNFISQKGNYVNLDGKVLGEHLGVIHYTIGQRKGLGIALGKPQFVIDKSAETNRVVLGDEEHLFKREVMVGEVNFIPFDTLTAKMRVTAKLRYRHIEQPATLYPLSDKKVKLIFDEPQRAPSPGQAAVFYDGEIVIGGGIITGCGE